MMYPTVKTILDYDWREMWRRWIESREVMDKIAAVDFWQDEAYFHPLTCAVKSSHEMLRAKEVDGEVVLICLTCGHQQEWIPDYVFGAYENIEQIVEARQRFSGHRNYREQA